MSHGGGKRRAGISDRTAQDARQGGIKHFDFSVDMVPTFVNPIYSVERLAKQPHRARQNTGLPMRKLVLRFVKNDAGATAIEYALIAAGISIVIVAAVNSIGTSLNSTFSSISSQLK